MRVSQTLFVIMMLVAFSTSALAEASTFQYLHPVGKAKYHELQSDHLGRSFHIFVSLPDAYADSQKNYPTIYLLDGGITFPLLSSFHQYLRFGDEVPEAILVGISYGAVTFEDGNMRSTDYSAPSTDRDYWGGASVFQNVLQDELFPLIERTYRSDSSQRIIFGQSMGGQFVLFTALTRPKLFSGHIASNPALHRNLPFFLQWHGEGEIPGPVSKLFVSNGDLNDERFQLPALKWVEYWNKQTPRPWLLETRILPGQTHFSIVPESFRQGLTWLYSEQD